MVEFLSREARQPDAELLAMIEDFGRLLEHAEASGIRLVEHAETVRPATTPDTFRALAGAVAAATDALERHPTSPTYMPPAGPLGELTARVGKLNRLLEAAVQRSNVEPSQREPPAPSGEATVELPTGLTLKAEPAHRDPGSHAPHLERRYGFMRPRRSPSGYRLHGAEEITASGSSTSSAREFGSAPP